MFVFYQVFVLPPTVCSFYEMYVCPLMFDNITAQQVPKVDSKLPIMIGGHAQDRILWAVD